MFHPRGSHPSGGLFEASRHYDMLKSSSSGNATCVEAVDSWVNGVTPPCKQQKPKVQSPGVVLMVASSP